VGRWVRRSPPQSTRILTSRPQTSRKTFVLAVTNVHNVLCASLTIHVGLTLRPPCQLMVRHRLVRLHDAAGNYVINEKIIRIGPFLMFRGIFDALEIDRPLLEVKVCMLADKPIVGATSIPNRDFDEVLDAIAQIQISIPDPWYMSTLLARRPHLK
jgi:flagellar biosynthesis regulator FlbT